MELHNYDPDTDSVKDRIQLIQLYSQAYNLRNSPREFQQAVQKAEDAMSSWLAKYGSQFDHRSC